MTKKEFDRQRQLLWVYLRHRGRCAVCGLEVSLAEAATSLAITTPLGIDELLQVKLKHTNCQKTAPKSADKLAPAA
jgi:uncharacterized protein (DUF983 family)